MLQIVGWLGCLYLVVKGFELAGHTRDGEVSSMHRVGSALAWLGAVAFAAIIYAQGQAASNALDGFGGLSSPSATDLSIEENLLEDNMMMMADNVPMSADE